MKKIMTICGAMLFASLILTSCGGNSIETDAKKYAELICKAEQLFIEGAEKAAAGDMSAMTESTKLMTEATSLATEMQDKYKDASDFQKFSALSYGFCASSAAYLKAAKQKDNAELSKNDVIGEWFASANGIKSKYIFNGDGSYTLVTEILGDFSSDEGKWEINTSKSINLTTNFGNRSTANFSKDFSSFSANSMNYSK